MQVLTDQKSEKTETVYNEMTCALSHVIALGSLVI